MEYVKSYGYMMNLLGVTLGDHRGNASDERGGCESEELHFRGFKVQT